MAKKSIIAIASLVAGLIALYFHTVLSYWHQAGIYGFFFDAVAIVLAIAALIGIKKTQGLEGKGFAIAGLILGILPFVVTLVFILLYPWE